MRRLRIIRLFFQENENRPTKLEREQLDSPSDRVPEDIALKAALSPVDSADNRPNNIDCPRKKKILPDFRLLSEEAVEETEDDDEESKKALPNGQEFTLEKTMFEEKSLECPQIDIDLQDSPSTPGDAVPELEEDSKEKRWRTVTIADKHYRLDMKVIEPYKKVLSHGGYYGGDGFKAIVVFCTCYLPDKRRKDYNYVMDNLFLYVVSTLELLVVEDYMIIFFHGATPKYKMPSLVWLKKCYDMIDRRLKKNLKRLLIVHPTIWLKTLMLMMKPFISSKFRNKVDYVKNLKELSEKVSTEYVYVPDEIVEFDKKLNKEER
ncbi:DgyrCDS1465 [Dimorphilus gyrociliatus]|uniref:DgyrCDS1465 n=1 Tax=Dimorphilus gyrociliatus TaxID=2664684 RepID=A0A7I8V988_9ANNE|nr:DgyrCDS1465 [Dimorphilus gyrociliatus]